MRNNNSGPFTTGQIARLSSVHVNVVKKWISEERLQAYRLPAGHFRILLDNYLKFLAAHDLPIPEELESPRRKLLIIDDDAEQNALLCDYLANFGRFDVELAEDGYQGLIKVGSFRPDLVFLDIAMPRMDGFGMLEAMEKQNIGQNPEIVVVTGNNTPETSARMEQFDIAAVIYKPYTLSQIDAVLEQPLKVQ